MGDWMWIPDRLQYNNDNVRYNGIRCEASGCFVTSSSSQIGWFVTILWLSLNFGGIAPVIVLPLHLALDQVTLLTCFPSLHVYTQYISAEYWDPLIFDVFLKYEITEILLLSMPSLGRLKKRLPFPGLLPAFTTTSIINGHLRFTACFFYWQLAFWALQPVRKSQVSEQLPAGWAAGRQREYLQPKNANRSPVFLIFNLAKHATEGGNWLRRIKVLFNPSGIWSVSRFWIRAS